MIFSSFLMSRKKRNISYLASAINLKFSLSCCNWGGNKADCITAETMGKLTIIWTGKWQILIYFLFNDSSVNKAFVCKHMFLKNYAIQTLITIRSCLFMYSIWTQKVLYHDSFTIGTDNIIDCLLKWKKKAIKCKKRKKKEKKILQNINCIRPRNSFHPAERLLGLVIFIPGKYSLGHCTMLHFPLLQSFQYKSF